MKQCIGNSATSGTRVAVEKHVHVKLGVAIFVKRSINPFTGTRNTRNFSFQVNLIVHEVLGDKLKIDLAKMSKALVHRLDLGLDFGKRLTHAPNVVTAFLVEVESSCSSP